MDILKVKAVSNLVRLNNGRSIPQLGFGTYRLADADASGAVKFAIECGFRHIDCAKVYRNQRAVGQGIAAALSAGGGVRRGDLFVTSKLWMTEYDPAHVRDACLDTLAELGLDYLDLYLMHYPVAWRRTGNWEGEGPFPQNSRGGADEVVGFPLATTWAAMEKLVDEGLVRSIGVSNFSVAEIDGLAAQKHDVALNQIEMHPALQQTKQLVELRMRGITPAAYCPLAAPTRFTPESYKGLCTTEAVQELSNYTGYSPQRVLLSWHADRSTVVVCKATSKEHIRDNANVHRFQIGKSISMILNSYEETFGSTRVINPTTFRATPGPFFTVP